MLLQRGVALLLTLALVGGVSSWLLRVTFPDAWTRWLARSIKGAMAAAVLGVLAWIGGRWAGFTDVAVLGATITAVFMVSGIFVFLSAPTWGLGGVLVRRQPDPARRAFLGRGIGVLPAAAAFTGPVGTVAASARPKITDVEVRSASVPAALDGLRILQLSDVHLGPFIDAAQVRAVVEDVQARGADAAPHLVVLTGDIVDDFELLPDAMKALRELVPPLGMYACIGNHEVYRGRDRAIALFEEGGARFLCDSGVLLEHNGARMWLGGADDPARLGGEHRPFLEQTVARCLEACPSDVTCRVVLSHRPEGFDAAARLGATLTLSGHTHGGQVALLGRSVFEGIVAMDYLLGIYRRGESTLYTTAGLGHWFPFRLNCPAEAALVTLRAAVGQSARDDLPNR